jgi:transcriptional regulator of heat shock response
LFVIIIFHTQTHMKKKTREEEEESIISNISETKQTSKFVQVLANKEATEHMYIFIGNGAQMKTVFVV